MKKWFAKRRPAITETMKRNLESIAQLEQEYLRQRSTVARLSDWITDVVGSPFFFAAHVVWFVSWVVLNTIDLFGIPHFDPYPFALLALAIASETALFSTCVLMSQKRQIRQADHWAHVNLQVSVLAHRHEGRASDQSCCIFWMPGAWVAEEWASSMVPFWSLDYIDSP